MKKGLLAWLTAIALLLATSAAGQDKKQGKKEMVGVWEVEHGKSFLDNKPYIQYGYRGCYVTRFLAEEAVSAHCENKQVAAGMYRLSQYARVWKEGDEVKSSLEYELREPGSRFGPFLTDEQKERLTYNIFEQECGQHLDELPNKIRKLFHGKMGVVADEDKKK